MTKKDSTFNAAVRLLSRRRYHSAEVSNKLRLKGYPESEIIGAIKRLKDFNYLNDSEYLSLYISDQLRFKPQSKRLIRQKLILKGINKDEVEEVLSNIRINEKDQAEMAFQKKIKTVKTGTPQQQKEKIQRFLASRGFTPAIIIETVKSYFEPLQK